MLGVGKLKPPSMGDDKAKTPAAPKAWEQPPLPYTPVPITPLSMPGDDGGQMGQGRWANLRSYLGG